MCTNALNPADILDISVDEANGVILVVVPHDQLSLAIGKRGQNARLASKLMGWNIDIKSDVELTEEGAAGGEQEKEATVEDSEAPAMQPEEPETSKTVGDSSESVTTDGAAEGNAGASEGGSDIETGGDG
jgi:transcription antitermination factor NusA-like protein